MDYLKKIITLLEQKQNVFLTGGAGVGKTTITKQVIQHYEEHHKKIAKLASTGMAATLFEGQTLHSFFELGIASNLYELEQNKKLTITNKLKKLLLSIDIIVIDEISMVSDTLFEMIVFRLKQANFMGSLLVVGDFLQLPPITRYNQTVRFAFEAPSWQELQFQTIELTHIYRTNDKNFIELLHHIRFGKIDTNLIHQLNQFIKPIPQNLNHFTFLFGKNVSASLHNTQQLAFIENELFIKEAQIVKHLKSIKDYECEKFMEDARIEKELALKIGAPILFTRNAWNYFNGERGVVIGIEADKIYIQKENKEIIKLEVVAQSKNVWKEKTVNGVKEMVEEPIITIYQYPIKLAFAITIHKSQGMSIENLIIQTNEIFSPSQFYVALSRSSNPSNLILIQPKKEWKKLIYVHPKALQFSQNICEN